MGSFHAERSSSSRLTTVNKVIKGFALPRSNFYLQLTLVAANLPLLIARLQQNANFVS